MPKLLILLRKVIGILLLLLILFSLIFHKFQFVLAICRITLSIYNGAESIRCFKNKKRKRGVFHLVISMGFLLIFLFDTKIELIKEEWKNL
ncbi:hypothetical protein J6TS2_05830 [Heyndrickxia sporothermodurans]|nr:hypothetical protein J6TS2_05830 [Heyndrickxia sporothermodurans]